MKTRYSELEMEILRFENRDVITTSNEGEQDENF